MSSSTSPERGARLLQLGRDADGSTTSPERWFAELEAADPLDIIAAIGGLGTRVLGDKERWEARRDAARAMVEHKLTERMIEKMEALERVSGRLGWIAVGVGVVGVIATLVSVL